MQKISFLILFLLFNSAISQNLVLNPSFEEYFDCPKGISFFHRNVKNWSVPNNGTTDYYNTCSESMGTNNFIGTQNPNTGNGFCGIYVYFKGDYREYIQGKLSKTLARNKKYTISFFVSLAEKSSHAIKEFQIVFMPTNLVSYSNQYIDLEELSKHSLVNREAYFTSEDFIDDQSNWVKLTTQFIASGLENYFIIGNFDRNSKLKKLKVNPSKGKPSSYYYIDDVSIELLENGDPNPISKVIVEEISLETDRIHVFKNVLFDFDKAILLDTSLEELEKLFIHLKNNPKQLIDIYGHTDSMGALKRNEELSQERAKSVADYLILQGLEPSRIRWFGFGSLKPVGTNETEDGRSQNRRVEFKLIDN